MDTEIKVWHCGDINPDTGLYFWSKSHNWLTKEQFDGYRAAHTRARKKFRATHPDYDRLQENKHKENNSRKRREYYLKNKPIVIARANKWAQDNPDAKKKIASKSQSKLRKTNTRFRARIAIANRIACAIRRKLLKKRVSTLDVIGCNMDQFMVHIQNQFQVGMAWNNWGLRGWHIDHIIPLSSANDIDGLERLCHYTNLQPLWAKDNLKKSNKILTNDGNHS